MFGAPAATHVETVGGPSGLEQFVGETLSVAGLTGAFQAVDYDYFRGGLAGGPLGMDENSYPRFAVIEFDFNRKT
jgi:hypothetical protein